MLKDVIVAVLTFTLPIAFAIGAGLISGKLNNKKSIKKYMDEICKECSYRSRSNQVATIEKEMALSIRTLTEIKADLKKEFLHYVISNNICKKEEVLDINNYFLFENTFNSAKEKILDELRTQFARNNILALSSFDIENRSQMLWNIITETFDQFYKTKERPSRIELYELFESKKDKHINTISRIYDESKGLQNV
jgi:hypothetical protein